MVTDKDPTSELLSILKAISPIIWLMHTMPNTAAYPETFFTYLPIDAPFVMHYDNRPHAVVWAFWIGFYSSDRSRVLTMPRELTKRLLAAGWVVPGLGEEVQSDEPTHTGWRLTAYRVEEIEI